MKDRLRYLLYLDLALVSLAGLLALIVVFSAGLRVERAEPPDNFGNNPRNVAEMADVNPNGFTFFALSDIKCGTATLEKLLSIAEQDRPAFGVILGDIVANPRAINHKLLAYRIKGLNLPFPLFLVIGNHEVDEEGVFGLSEYEQLYGSTQFHFVIGKNLFMFLRNADPYNETGDYVRYFERTLTEYAGQNLTTFVFMHVPPSSFGGAVLMSGADHAKEFMDLARKFAVRYVFCGDHHGYVKNVVGDTTYVVTGGGGDRLRGEHGRFHHFTRIAVNRDQVTETVIAVQQQDEAKRLIERNIVTYLWPIMAGNTIRMIITVALAILLIGLMSFGIRGCMRLNGSVEAPQR